MMFRASGALFTRPAGCAMSAEPASAERVWGTVDVNGLPLFYETEGTGGPITYQAMAEETVELLRTVALGPSDLVGWSDGGMVAFLVATSHPDLVHTLTLVGSPFSSNGYVPESMEELTSLPADDDELAMFAAMYAEVSPDGPGRFATVWEKVRTYHVDGAVRLVGGLGEGGCTGPGNRGR